MEMPKNYHQVMCLGQLGRNLLSRHFVYTDFAGDSLMYRSRIVFYIYCNGAPIFWLSKNQTLQETRLFGSELIAIR